LAVGSLPSIESDRVVAACRPLADLAHGPASDRSAVRAVLSTAADAGGMDLSFLTGTGSRPSAADIRKIVGHLYALAGLSWTIASIYMINPFRAGALISAGGSERQRHSLLPLIRKGGALFAFAMTEPEAGSDAANIQTRADATEEGFVISGEKHYITGADSADQFLVVARSGERRRSFSVFLVPASTPGLEVEVQPKLAMHLHASCRVVFEDAQVPPDSVLGGPEAVGDAWSLLRYAGSLEGTAVAAMAAGAAASIVQRCLGFGTDRVQFGQPIASFQSVQHTLVDMASLQRVMELLVIDALGAWDEGGDVTRATSTAKYLCAEYLQDIVAKAMRVLGGRAFFDHEAMSRMYKEAPFALYAGGTNEIQRNLVARSLGLLKR
jgi:alkylation response protein AidB-like acyl-CoA dehydrogenase